MEFFKHLRAWRSSRQKARANVDDSHTHVLDLTVMQRIDEAEGNIVSAIDVLGAPTRRRSFDLLLSIGLTFAFFAGALILYLAAIPHTPLAPAAGAIGLAVSGSERPVAVQATFSVASTDHTEFRLIIPADDPTAVPGREFFLYFCGPVKEGLQLTDVNTGPLEVRDDRKSATVYESSLGDRSMCVTAASQPSQTGQSIITGSYASPIVHQSVYRILYALPVVRTLVTREDMNGTEVGPLSPGSTISVSIDDAPKDLSVAAASPLIPESGQLSWKWEVSPLGTPYPTTYRIAGVLMDAEAHAQAEIFAAGTLLGVAGSGFIWLIQLFAERSNANMSVRRNSSSPKRKGFATV